MIEKLLTVQDLTLQIREKKVLDNINMAVKKGETVLIAGKNGSGKSTFLRCLAGVLFADGGKIDYNLERKKIGFISDKMSLLENYSIKKGIQFHCGVYGIKKFNPSLINELNCPMDQEIKHLSAGERAIFQLSLMISQKPQLLILDEIIHAIDPYFREIFLEKLIEMMDELNTTIIMVNHTFADIQRIPERILIMEEGRFVLDETREDLIAKTRKVFSKVSLQPDLPVIFRKESPVFNEYYIYPFSDDLKLRNNSDFLNINLAEIIRAFIGGYYDQKRIQ